LTDTTNRLPVGQEPGRGLWEAIAKESRTALKIRHDPYHKFYISNAAKLDSLGKSTLEQGPGSRAYLIDVGTVPGYDYFSPEDQPRFIFLSRGLEFYRVSVMNFLRDNQLL
jgi:hypothetical protein